MALTDQSLADAMRSELADATRLRPVAEALVMKHAAAAPEALRDEAAIRVAAYLLDRPPSPPGAGYANVLTNSGAAALLSQWRVRRAGKVAVRDG